MPALLSDDWLLFLNMTRCSLSDSLDDTLELKLSLFVLELELIGPLELPEST